MSRLLATITSDPLQSVFYWHNNPRTLFNIAGLQTRWSSSTSPMYQSRYMDIIYLQPHLNFCVKILMDLNVIEDTSFHSFHQHLTISLGLEVSFLSKIHAPFIIRMGFLFLECCCWNTHLVWKIWSFSLAAKGCGFLSLLF